MQKILITREIEAAQNTKKAFMQLGYQVEILPLIKIVPCKCPTINYSDYNYIIISSFNAAKIIVTNTLMTKTPFIVIGNKSAQYLKEHGFNVKYVFINSDQLLSHVTIFPNNQKFLFLSGDHVAADILTYLINVGHTAKQIILYRSLKILDYKGISFEGVDIITFYSPRTAEAFNNIFANCLSDVKECFKNITCISLSASIDEKLKLVNFKERYIAQVPTEAAVISILQSLNGA